MELVPKSHPLCLSAILDELEELFYWCTDNDNTLVVNIPPDQTGRIREHEANTIIGLNKRLGIKKREAFTAQRKVYFTEQQRNCLFHLWQ